jgi:hypothetical protein
MRKSAVSGDSLMSRPSIFTAIVAASILINLMGAHQSLAAKLSHRCADGQVLAVSTGTNTGECNSSFTKIGGKQVTVIQCYDKNGDNKAAGNCKYGCGSSAGAGECTKQKAGVPPRGPGGVLGPGLLETKPEYSTQSPSAPGAPRPPAAPAGRLQ